MWFRAAGNSVDPDFGPEFEAFRNGLAMLCRDGEVLGHVATALGHFRTPFSPRAPQPWVWLVVVWRDGTKERAVEDYPPWTYVAEMREGYIDWEGGRDRSRAGRYEVQWVPPEQASAERARLGIRREDF